jgi:hypothetical protein
LGYQPKDMYGGKAVRMANVLDVLKYGYGNKVGEYLVD